MPTFEQHTPGMPNWVDVMVETTEQRERLLEFYSALFGWTWDVSPEEMGSYSIGSSDGHAVIGIGQGPGGAGIMVPYFATADIAASTELAAKNGGTPVMGPMDVSDVGKMSLVADPTGAMHGLWQAGTFAGFGVQYEPNSIGWFDHESSDPGAAGAYYAALTGNTVMEPDPGMKILSAGDQWFASLTPNTYEHPAMWSPIYIADSLERVREVVRKQGGTVFVEERQVPGTAITTVTEPVMGTNITVMQPGASA